MSLDPEDYPRTGVVLTITAGILLVVDAALYGVARAQLPASEIDFSRQLPRIRSFEPVEEPAGDVLPAIAPDTDQLAAGARVFARAYAISGNTVVSDAELLSVAQPYTNRYVTFSELEQLRDDLTLAYVERGFVSSGALLPQQTVSDGTIRYRILEGTLDQITVETDGRFGASYFEDRINALGPVVNVPELEQRLQLFQQQRPIQNVAAQLSPGTERGQANLSLRVTEAAPYDLDARVANDVSPSVGGESLSLHAAHVNLTANGDPLHGTFRAAEGLEELNLDYVYPISRNDISVGVHFEGAESEVVDDAFEDLEIESESTTYGLSLRWPITRTPQRDFDLVLRGDVRRSESFLLGTGFSFTEGPDEGESKVTALRFGQEWSQRGLSQVLALRSQFSVGVDALDATTNGGDVPDGEFIAWLGQAQWGRRVDFLNATVLARTDLQLTDSPLLGLEQYSIGGQDTVRGYRENTLVRDNGAIVSLEGQVPLWFNRLQLAAFVDVGESWNQDRDTVGPRTIYSVGLGLLWNYRNQVDGRVYLAEALKDVDTTGEDDVQDDGVHFSVSAYWR